MARIGCTGFMNHDTVVALAGLSENCMVTLRDLGALSVEQKVSCGAILIHMTSNFAHDQIVCNVMWLPCWASNK